MNASSTSKYLEEGTPGELSYGFRYLEYPAWGVMKLRDHFNHADSKIAARHHRRLLRKMGIMAIYRKPNLSMRNTEHSV